MTRSLVVPGAFALALLATPAAHAVTDADLTQIRDEIRQLKESYEARIQALEQRLKDAEAKSAVAGTVPAPSPAAPPAAAPSVANAASAPASEEVTSS